MRGVRSVKPPSASPTRRQSATPTQQMTAPWKVGENPSVGCFCLDNFHPLTESAGVVLIQHEIAINHIDRGNARQVLICATFEKSEEI